MGGVQNYVAPLKELCCSSSGETACACSCANDFSPHACGCRSALELHPSRIPLPLIIPAFNWCFVH